MAIKLAPVFHYTILSLPEFGWEDAGAVYTEDVQMANKHLKVEAERK